MSPNFVLSQFLTSAVTSSSLPSFFPHNASFRASKRWKSEEARPGLYGEWGRTVLPSFVIAFSVLKLVYGWCVVMWKEDFSNFSVRPKSPEMLVQGFNNPWCVCGHLNLM